MELMLLYVVLSLLTALFLKWGRQLGKRFPKGNGFFCVIFLGTGCSICFFSGGSLGWGRWVAPDAAYLASYTPALLVVLAIGAISVHQDLPPAKRGFLCGGLGIALLLLFAAIELRPYVRPLRLASSDQWLGDVCLQSHESSCVPAALVNLLHRFGMNTNEKTMARWAHTSCDGTPPIGSYMALAQAVSNSPWQAQVLRQEISFPKAEHMPLLAHVRFDDEPEEKRVTVSNFFSELICGIQARNQGHAVVILGRDHKGWHIADPASGPSVWSDECLQRRWKGEGVYLSLRQD